ncbi:MAG: exosome complex RNA-binding protein Csl4 [Candidatus Thermoplasmatota archaeon]|nr:exosome complex RNA-binding protein Csl4 [Candidatus Thermoplasmatota archaeon]
MSHSSDSRENEPPKEKKLVFPGDELAVSEEYIAGEGTLDERGKIYASTVGIVELDSKERVLRVKAFNPPITLKNGDDVIAVISGTRESMGTADVVQVEGKKRSVSGDTNGSIHVSKVSSSYTKSVKGEFYIGDIIRAKVISTDPSLQLATTGKRYGVLKGFCTQCRIPMIRKGNTLYCESCDSTDRRKISSDYGDTMVETEKDMKPREHMDEKEVP